MNESRRSFLKKLGKGAVAVAVVPAVLAATEKPAKATKKVRLAARSHAASGGWSGDIA